MKLKEIPRTATFAWSPDLVNPTLFTGTASGTIDSNFDTSMCLESWKLNFLDESANAFTPESSGRVETDSSFLGIAVNETGEYVAGALENGTVIVWKTSDLSEVGRNSSAHTGSVLSISFSRKEPSKFATGGSDGQVLIWEVDDLENPTPAGNVTAQSHDEIKSVSWNNNAPHILASGGSKGIVNIWDTKKRKDVIHLSYNNAAGNRVPISCVQWHPSNSTKIVTSCIDDSDPVICVWDLKNVNSPEKILKGHTKGVLSLDWCRQDENLLLSGGRDDSTRLWNPVTGVEIGSYPLSVEWAFCTKFHPTLPDVLASASFEGKISVQSLQDTNGGTNKSASTSNDDFWDNNNVMDVVHPSFKLSTAPKWLRKPSGAVFGFGGKLVSVVDNKVVVKTVKDSAFDLSCAKEFSTAFTAGNYKDIIEKHHGDESWDLLGKVVNGEDVLNLAELGINDHQQDQNDDEDDEFNIVPQYTPSGEFSLLDESQKPVIFALLNQDWDAAVTKLIDSGKLDDALLVASYGDAGLIARAQNAYLSKYATEKPYLRTAWNVANKDVFDFVNNAELKAWPVVLDYALKQDNATTKSSAISKLSDKLREAGETNNALKASLLGKNAAAAAEIWLEEVPEIEKKLREEGNITKYNAHVSALQVVVEKISVAARLLGLPTTETPGAEKLYAAIRDFAGLASQHGDLELAKLFLDMLPSEFDSDKKRVDIATNSTGAAATATTSARRGNYGTRASVGSINVPGANTPSLPAPSAPGAPQATTQQSFGAPPAGLGFSVPPPTAAADSLAAPIGTPEPSTFTPGKGSIPQPMIPQSTISPARASLAAANNINSSPTAKRPVQGPPRAGLGGPIPQILSKSHASGWNDITALGLENRSGSPSVPTRAAAVNVAPPQTMTPAAQSPTVASSAGNTPLNPPPGRAPPPRIGSAAPRAVRAKGSRQNMYAPPPNAGPQPHPPTSSASPQPPASAASPFGASSGFVNVPPPGKPRSVSRASSRSSSISHSSSYAPMQAAQVPVPPPPSSKYAPPTSRPEAIPPLNTTIPAPGPVPPSAIQSPMTTAPPRSSTPSVDPKSSSKKPAGLENIPEHAREIYTAFQNELERVRPVVEAQYAKQYKDTRRRLQILNDELASSTLSEGVVSLLHSVGNMINEKDYNNAATVLQDITTKFEGEVGEWMTGVKRLVKMGAGVI